MKLKENVFKLTDDKGIEHDLRKEKISVLNNGEDRGVEVKDLFIRYTIERDAIVGHSPLRYFTIKDGVLADKEGNSVQFYLPEKKLSLHFKKIDVKFVALDPIHVTVAMIEAFSYLLIGMKQPEMIFTDLSNAEKKEIVTNRELKEENEAKENTVKYEKDLSEKANVEADKAVEEFTDDNIAIALITFDEYQKLANASPDTVKAIGDKLMLAQQKRDEKKSKEMNDVEQEKNAADKANQLADAAVADSTQENIDKALEALNEYDKLENASKDSSKELAKKIETAQNNLASKKDDEKKRVKEEKERKAKVNPKFLYESTDYFEMKEYFDGLGGKEYIKGDYHFFHAPETENEKKPVEPLLLIKRGTWWEEPEDAEVVEKNDKVVMYQFKDEKKDKVLALDLEKVDIFVEDAKKEPAK